MKHHKKGRSLNRSQNQKRALVRHLASSLIIRGKIKTTEAKAKELRSFIERLTTEARKGSIASKRRVTSKLGNITIGNRLIKEIAPQYKSRPGGYTRITKLPRRKGDGSKMAIIEFVS